MQRIKLWDRYFDPLIDPGTLSDKVRELAAQINRDYAGKRPVFVAVLDGAIHFASDLTRLFEDKCELVFVKYSSYNGTNSSGSVKEILDLQIPVFGRHVVVLEDIVDTGLTTSVLMENILLKRPLSLGLAVLLYRQDAPSRVIRPDYGGFGIGKEFVVGYGMDYNGLGRNLPAIYQSISK